MMYFNDYEEFEDWDANATALETALGGLSQNIKKALAIVETYHNQPRTVGAGNYNRHPLRVARIVAEELQITNEETILIALCHDLGEWSTYNIENLKNEFGNEVYEGVQALTWDQKEKWSDFVERIVNSNIRNLIAIKIADKLDNNRAIALSGNAEAKQKAKTKTIETILPLVEKYFPQMKNTYDESLARL